jgi:hypothetical protein
MNTRRTARAAAAVAAAVLAAAGLTGCGQDQYDQVCIDRHTHRRVADVHCRHHTAGDGWWWVPYGYAVPAVGHPVDVDHGTSARPTAAAVRTARPTRGYRVGGRTAKPGRRPNRITRRRQAPAWKPPARPAAPSRAR